MANTRKVPRNAVIGALALLVAAGAMGIALLIPWNKGAKEGGSDIAGTGPTDTGAAAAPSVQPNAGARGQPGRSAGVGGAALTLGTVLDISHEEGMKGVEATRVTVDYDELLSIGALAAFSDQAGFLVQMPSAGRGQALPEIAPASMHLHETPLLAGLLELFRSTHVRLTEMGESGATVQPITLTNPDDPANPGIYCVSGPFAMVIARLQRTTVLDAAGGQGSASSLIAGSLYAEPSLKVTKYPDQLDFETFVDEKDQTIGVQNPRIYARTQRNVPRVVFSMQLSPPESPGRVIARLRARATFTLMSKSQVVQTSDPGEHAQQTIEGMGVEIMPLTQATGQGAFGPATMTQLNCEIRYTRGSMARDRWEKLAPVLPEIDPEVFGAGGEPVVAPPPLRIQRPPSTGNLQETVVVAMTLRGTGARAPHHLKLTVPLEVREVSVPFEFRNLVMP